MPLSEKSQPSKALNVTFWILQVLAAAWFFIAGATKLAGVEMTVGVFEEIGFGQWFRYFIGGLEVSGATLLLVPKTAALGATLLAEMMVGAIQTRLLLIGGSPVGAIVLLLVTLAVAWYRRPVSLR